MSLSSSSQKQDQESNRLAAAAYQGDREAFEKLVNLFQQRIFGLIVMMLRNHHAAEEVAQETFIRAFTQMDLYDPKRPFYPWLATIAVRLTQNWQKRQSLKQKREDSLDEKGNDPVSRDAPLDSMVDKEVANQLWKTVATLPMGERTAIFLFYRQELKVDQIAQVLGVTSGTVKTMLFRARKKLRTHDNLQHMGQARSQEDS